MSVDSYMSALSTNPVQNRVISAALDILDSAKLSVDGGSLYGMLDMHNSEIHNVICADDSFPLNAASKTYVDSHDALGEKLANKVTSIGANADDSHYPSAKAVKDYADSLSAPSYTPVLLYSQTLTEDTPEIVINSYNSNPFYARSLCVQLDVPATASAQRIQVNALRSNSTYLSLIPQYADAKTVTDSSKHTLVDLRVTVHSNVWFEVSTALMQPAANVSWANEYHRAPVYAWSGSALPFNAEGLQAIRILLANSASLPAGTKINVWGEIKQ